MKLSQFIAGCFGTVGFVVSILAGMFADNSFNTILTHAMLAAGACYVIGYIAGAIAQHAAIEHAQVIADKVAKKDAEEAARKAEEEAENAESAGETVAAAEVPPAPAQVHT